VVDLGIGGNWDRRLSSRRHFLGAADGLAGLLAVGSLPAEKAVAAPPNGNVVDPNAPSYTAAAFAVESGAPGAQRV